MSVLNTVLLLDASMYFRQIKFLQNLKNIAIGFLQITPHIAVATYMPLCVHIYRYLLVYSQMKLKFFIRHIKFDPQVIWVFLYIDSSLHMWARHIQLNYEKLVICVYVCIQLIIQCRLIKLNIHLLINTKDFHLLFQWTDKL